MAESHHKVLLLDGSSLSTLAITRSLARAKIGVTVAAETPHSMAGVSRYCEKTLVYPSPLTASEDFRRWLLATLSEYRFDFLIGTTDPTVTLLDELREELRSRVKVLLPNHCALVTAYDNAATTRLAQELGLTTPETHFIENWEEFEELARDLKRLVVIRPRTSIACQDGTRRRVHVEFASDESTLREKYVAAHQISPWPLVKEYVSGTGVGCFFLIRQGQVLARFQHRRIRESNPLGSGSCMRVSVAADPALMAASERLLGAMNYEGLAMVEYRITDEGTAYLMEINPRPWGSMQLAVEAGVDFPLLWYRASTGQPAGEVPVYRSGVECRYLVGELQHLESVLHGPPKRWPVVFPGRAATILRFCKFFGRNLHYDEFAAGDWRPGLAELRNYFADLGIRIRRKLRSKLSSRSESQAKDALTR